MPDVRMPVNTVFWPFVPNSSQKRKYEKAYVHGYDERENIHLRDYISTLVELPHSDTSSGLHVIRLLRYGKNNAGWILIV